MYQNIEQVNNQLTYKIILKCCLWNRIVTFVNWHDVTIIRVDSSQNNIEKGPREYEYHVFLRFFDLLHNISRLKNFRTQLNLHSGNSHDSVNCKKITDWKNKIVDPWPKLTNLEITLLLRTRTHVFGLKFAC